MDNVFKKQVVFLLDLLKYCNAGDTIVSCRVKIKLIYELFTFQMMQQTTITTKTNTSAICFFVAAINGEERVKTVKHLIELGLSIECMNDEGLTPLMYAARNGHIDVVKILIEAGSSLEATDNEGNNAMLHACHGGHVEIIDLLDDTQSSNNEPIELVEPTVELDAIALELEEARKFIESNSNDECPSDNSDDECPSDDSKDDSIDFNEDNINIEDEDIEAGVAAINAAVEAARIEEDIRMVAAMIAGCAVEDLESEAEVEDNEAEVDIETEAEAEVDIETGVAAINAAVEEAAVEEAIKQVAAMIATADETAVAIVEAVKELEAEAVKVEAVDKDVKYLECAIRSGNDDVIDFFEGKIDQTMVEAIEAGDLKLIKKLDSVVSKISKI